MYKILTNSTDQSELKYLKTLINISQHIVITKTVVFIVILPPIIFESGYNLHKVRQYIVFNIILSLIEFSECRIL
jgi:NhaP-type Na+/H+ or K+/H+ antiporter